MMEKRKHMLLKLFSNRPILRKIHSSFIYFFTLNGGGPKHLGFFSVNQILPSDHKKTP